MTIKQNISLKTYNTFGIDVNATHFATAQDIPSLQTLLTDKTFQQRPKLILGGGSNILFLRDFDGLVIHNQFKGIEHIKEDNQHVYLKVGAGESWHQFVMYCVSKQYSGVENLSLIPGTVGAAPIQNIGAYGIEVKHTLALVHVVSIDGKRQFLMRNEDCQFGYRDSVFKQALKDKCVITHVTFRLNKTPAFHVEYGGIKQVLENNQVTELSLKAISDAVIQIRQQKLPDPQKIGNAGSFFKNPIIKTTSLHTLKSIYPDIPFYIVSEEEVKIPAAWLIEQSGFKGKSFGNTAVYDKQPLVLVNRGNATGEEVYALAQKIQQSVLDKFDIMLNTEVNII